MNYLAMILAPKPPTLKGTVRTHNLLDGLAARSKPGVDKDPSVFHECTHCGSRLPETAFYANNGGLRLKCGKCVRKDADKVIARRKANTPAGFQYCTGGNHVRHESEFIDENGNKRALCAACRVKRTEQKQRHKQRNQAAQHPRREAA